MLAHGVVLSVVWLIIDDQKTVIKLIRMNIWTNRSSSSCIVLQLTPERLWARQEERNNSNNGHAQQTPNTKHGNKTERCTPTVGRALFVWHAAPTKGVRSIHRRARKVRPGTCRHRHTCSIITAGQVGRRIICSHSISATTKILIQCTHHTIVYNHRDAFSGIGKKKRTDDVKALNQWSVMHVINSFVYRLY
jgi:hypothetical protein